MHTCTHPTVSTPPAHSGFPAVARASSPSACRPVGRFSVIPGRFVLVLVALVVGLWAPVAITAADTVTDRARIANPSKFSIEQDLLDFIDELIEILDSVGTASGSSPGPLSDPTRTIVGAYLDHAEDIVDQILDPNQYPSLNPSNTGAIDGSVNPDTLADYTEESLKLAEDAALELQSGSGFDQALVGSKLKTIKHLLTRTSPHNYRSRAGL